MMPEIRLQNDLLRGKIRRYTPNIPPGHAKCVVKLIRTQKAIFFAHCFRKSRRLEKEAIKSKQNLKNIKLTFQTFYIYLPAKDGNQVVHCIH